MEGITLATYQAWKGDDSITCDQLQNITSGEITTIYHDNYWAPVSGDILPSGVDLVVVDMAVNAGVGGSARILQATLGVSVDGEIGPETLAAVQNADPTSLINAVCDHQASYYQSLGGFQYFGRGWLARVEARRATALTMISTPTMMAFSQRVHPLDQPSADFFIQTANLI